MPTEYDSSTSTFYYTTNISSTTSSSGWTWENHGLKIKNPTSPQAGCTCDERESMRKQRIKKKKSKNNNKLFVLI